MLFTLFYTALFVAFGACHVAASNLQLDTPTLTQCQDAVLSYSGGQAPYSLYVVPSEKPCDDSVVFIPEQSGTKYTWKVNIPAGSKVELMVEDPTGDEAWSGNVTVQNSTDTSCIDSKAAQALGAAKGASTASGASSASSSSTSSGGAPTTTPNSPSAYGNGPAAAPEKTVSPAAAPAGVANAIGGSNLPPSSRSIPRAALPAGSLVAVAVFILALGHC